MITPVITEESASKILSAANIKPDAKRLPEIAARMDGIARAFFTVRYFRHPQPRTKKPMGAVKAARRALRGMGSRGRLPATITREARVQLFGDLVGLWFEEAREWPKAVVRWDKGGAVTGRFIAFSQAYCGALADYLDREQQQQRGTAWRGVMVSLRAIEQSGSKAREGLRLILGKRA